MLVKDKQLPIIHLAVATVHENRLPIFDPTNRPQERKKVMTTPYGNIIVQGRLGQRHKDLLEIVRVIAEKIGKTSDSRLCIIVDLYLLRKKLGKYYSYETLLEFFKDLLRTNIELEIPHLNIGFNPTGQFLESVIPVKDGEKVKLRIEFGKFGTLLYAKDIKIFYDPEPISKMKHGISKAVARHVLSHANQPNGGWKLDTLIHAVLGKNVKEYEIRKARKRIREDAKMLKSCGIEIIGDRIFLTKKLENTTSVPQKPESVPQKPESVPQKPESVPQKPESVPQKPESVPV